MTVTEALSRYHAALAWSQWELAALGGGLVVAVVLSVAGGRLSNDAFAFLPDDRVERRRTLWQRFLGATMVVVAVVALSVALGAAGFRYLTVKHAHHDVIATMTEQMPVLTGRVDGNPDDDARCLVDDVEPSDIAPGILHRTGCTATAVVDGTLVEYTLLVGPEKIRWVRTGT